MPDDNAGDSWPGSEPGVNPGDVTAAQAAADAAQADIDAHEAATGTAVHGLGNAATRNVGTGSGNVAAGDAPAAAQAAAISAAATDATTKADAAKARATHTGVQAASTISDFTEASQDVIGALLGADTGDLDFTYDDNGNAESVAIKNDAVTLAKLANSGAAARVLGQIVGGSGDYVELTPTQLRAVLGVFSAVRTTDATAIQSDQTVNDDDVLFITGVPVGTYEMTANIFQNSGVAPDFRSSFSFSGTATMKWGTAGGHSAAGAFADSAQALTADLVTIGLAADGLVVLKGTLVVTASGDLHYRWAQGTSTASDTKVLSGSALILRQIA